MFKLMVLEKRKRDKPKRVLGGKLSSVAQRSSERWPTSAWEREAPGGGRSEIWWWGEELWTGGAREATEGAWPERASEQTEMDDKLKRMNCIGSECCP